MQLEKRLQEIINDAKKEYFVEEHQTKASDEETLGILISKFCQWNGNKIFRVSYNAFEDSNFHSFNEEFEELFFEKLEEDRLKSKQAEAVNEQVWRLLLMTLQEKKKLIDDYMSKCPFIEKYDIVIIDDEWARVELDIAFDSDK